MAPNPSGKTDSKWAVSYCESSAFAIGDEPSLPEVDPDGELIAYFKAVVPGDVGLFRTEPDLLIENAIHAKKNGDPIRTLPSFPLISLPEVLTYETAMGGHVRGHILSAEIRRIVFREAQRSDSALEVSRRPLEGLADAYIMKPTKPLEPGAYLMIVTGANAASITGGKGGTVFRVGPPSIIADAIRDGRERAEDQAEQFGLSRFMKFDPRTALPDSELDSLRDAFRRARECLIAGTGSKACPEIVDSKIKPSTQESAQLAKMLSAKEVEYPLVLISTGGNLDENHRWPLGAFAFCPELSPCAPDAPNSRKSWRTMTILPVRVELSLPTVDGYYAILRFERPKSDSRWMVSNLEIGEEGMGD